MSTTPTDAERALHDEIHAAWRADRAAMHLKNDARTPREAFFAGALWQAARALPVDGLDAVPNDLRDIGLSVAVHNDYHLNGQRFTFWLMTDAVTGKFYKGEGKTDADALNKIRAAIAKQQEPS